jgi:hypothetical protein
MSPPPDHRDDEAPTELPAAGEVTTRARDLLIARQAFEASPVVREEIVGATIDTLAAGEYCVTPEMIAERVLPLTPGARRRRSGASGD